MNRKTIKQFQIFSLIFTFILGTFLHFTYNLSGNNLFVASFSAVNESVWEHLKILYFPILLTIVIGCFYFKYFNILDNTIPNFICSKTIGVVIAMSLLVTFFFTYTGVLGKNIAIIDIGSFFVFSILATYISYILIINKFSCNKKTAIITLIIITVLFIFFTYCPLKIGLFKDPVTGSYGVFKT